MKKSPETIKLEEVLRSSKIVAGGFLGTDTRSLTEIIDADLAVVDSLGYDQAEVAGRMREITNAAKTGLSSRVKINERLTAWIDEAKGVIVCPWPHPAGFAKRVTTVIDIETNEQICWSDLNIHLIERHGFFEGKGSSMRIEPKKLINLIF